MEDHDRIDGETVVPPELGQFTRGLATGDSILCPMTGAEVLAALEKIESGRDAFAVGKEIAEEKWFVRSMS